MKSFQIFLLLVLLSCLIKAESIVSEMSRLQVEKNKHTIPISGNRLLTWDKSIVQLDNHIIYRKSEGQIINVMSNSIGQDPAAVIITSNSHQKNTFSILLIDDGGKVKAFKTIHKPFDEGIPTILFADSDILLIKPEEQIILVYPIDGSKESEYHLFDKPSWSHEKRIIFSKNSHGQYFLLGMRSADLKNSQNVTLFKMVDQPKLLAELPLTVPYHFTISDKNISAMIGTKSISGNRKQKPFLILLNKSKAIIHRPLELNQLPQKTIWVRDKLFLIYRDHLIVYDSNAQLIPQKVKFSSQIFPFEVFSSETSVFIVSGNGIEADQKGNVYSLIDLVEYNIETHFVSVHTLQDGPIRKVEYFPSEATNAFYLRLDNKLVQYRISN